MHTAPPASPESTLAPSVPPPKGSRLKRNDHPLLPLWRICGALNVQTPLALGTGEDEPIAQHLGEGTNSADSFIPAVARDYRGLPYIPGSSLKGALRAMAARLQMDANAVRCWLGSDKADGSTSTSAGALEIRNAYLDRASLPGKSGLPDFVATHNGSERHTALIPHVVIHRHTGTADEGLLFQEQVVPPGVQFAVEIIARGVDEASVRELLGLLEAINLDEQTFSLGKNSGKSNGSVRWQLSEVKQRKNFAMLQDSGSNLWSNAQALNGVNNIAALTANTATLHLNAQLKFHTPFLVYQGDVGQARGGVNGKARRNHQDHGVLPASSLHGALRSQAERILRTLGQKVARPHDVCPVEGLEEAAQKLDEVGLLFGTTGWKGLLQCSDFTAPKDAPTVTHHMLAIDRITGGGKDGAKFSVEALDCPTLSGSLRLDLPRWRKLSEKDTAKAHRALALLLHTLRDLDEGDIPLGYGASKGYGQSTSRLAGALGEWLDNHAPNIPNLPGTTKALEEWQTHFKDAQVAANLVSSNQKPKSFDIEEPGTGDFHNPYVFVPFGRPQADDPRLPWNPYTKVHSGKEPSKGGSPHSHAAYHGQCFNGRLVCRLTPQTSWFVGAGAGDAEAQNANQATLHQPYKMEGKHAIPATSLRGLISSLHESVTQSRLRVMHETTYSIRTPMDTPLSAIGRLCEIGGKFWLQLVALPTLSINKQHQAEIPVSYRKLLSPMRSGLAPLKSLFADLSTDDVPAHLIPPNAGAFPRRFMRKPLIDPMWFEAGRSNQILMDIDDGPNSPFHIKTAGQSRFLLGFRRRKDEFPITEDDRRNRADKNLWQPGFVRLMAHAGRDLVQSRKHEVFLPELKFPPADINARKNINPDLKVSSIDLTAEYQLLPISDDVIQRFCRLADEMTASQDNKPDLEAHEIRPYQPLGRARGAGDAVVYHDLKHPERALRPKNGDFVYFKPADDGNSIAEISYSSLWRQEIAATSSDWVPEPLRPLNHATDPAKAVLSPSEWLFGALQVRDGTRHSESSKTEPILAFASKVRFSPATWTLVAPEEAGEAVTLKILASPKPPSPAMYVVRAGARSAEFVSKLELFKGPKTYQFKGRKSYIGALRNTTTDRVEPLNNEGQVDGQSMPWISANAGESIKQKVRIHPLTGGVFHFSVDFRNLSQAELESLCSSLSPHHGFEHKIGMGKPLGLGSFKIEFTGLYLVDRVQRYRQTIFDKANRYQAVWSDGSDPRQLPAHLGTEAAAGAGSAPAPSPRDLAEAQMHHLERKAPEVYRALVLSGSPQAVKLPVHYPQLENLRLETETFQWFVNNDAPPSSWEGRQQALACFTPLTNSLPALSRDPRRKKQR